SFCTLLPPTALSTLSLTRRSSDLLLHSGEGFGVDDVARLFGQGRVQGDEVRPRQQFIEFDLLDTQFLGPSLRKERVVCDDMHFRSEEHTSELQSRENLVCRLLLEK